MEENANGIHPERQPINFWTLIGIVLTLVINAATVGGVYVGIRKDITDIQTKVSDEDVAVKQIQTDLPPIKFEEQQLRSETDENKADIKAITTSFGDKLETILHNLDVLGTKMEDMQKAKNP